ncbi:MAG: glycerophosphodiester phosphodiesterase family protein [Chitinophagaceae bacterium]|nr:glycerophosphodiester phosphodiesterase family protein [Chitinophagaceae bacterium]
MRHLFRLLLPLLLAGCAPRTYLRQLPPTYFQYNADSQPAISAHRGGGDYAGYPENCIESFEWLARQMPVVIECDINLTKDSVLVMMHDDKLDRTSTGTGKIADTTWAYLQTLQLKDNGGRLTSYRIPTLPQVLAWGRNKVAFTLDVKRSVPFELVVKAVQAARAQRYAAIITYNAADAAKVYKLDSTIMISVTLRSREEYDRHVALGIPDHRMLAFVGTREPNAEWMKWLHQKGIRCILGTLGNLDKMAATRGDSLYQRWYSSGADIMSSDRPLEAWKALQAIR